MVSDRCVASAVLACSLSLIERSRLFTLFNHVADTKEQLPTFDWQDVAAESYEDAVLQLTSSVARLLSAAEEYTCALAAYILFSTLLPLLVFACLVHFAALKRLVAVNNL